MILPSLSSSLDMICRLILTLHYAKSPILPCRYSYSAPSRTTWRFFYHPSIDLGLGAKQKRQKYLEMFFFQLLVAFIRLPRSDANGPNQPPQSRLCWPEHWLWTVWWEFFFFFSRSSSWPFRFLIFYIDRFPNRTSHSGSGTENHR